MNYPDTDYRAICWVRYSDGRTDTISTGPVTRRCADHLLDWMIETLPHATGGQLEEYVEGIGWCVDVHDIRTEGATTAP